MWSDYEFKLCSTCGFKSYHEKGYFQCRDCVIRRMQEIQVAEKKGDGKNH